MGGEQLLTYGETMEQIQALSEERQGLWRLAGRRTLAEAERDRLLELNGMIDYRWGQYRREWAAANRPAQAPKPANIDALEDYLDRAGATETSSYQVQDGGRWRNVDDAALAEGIRRYTADIPADDPGEVEIVPLKVLLARRGLTLQWQTIRGGSTYGKLVALPG